MKYRLKRDMNSYYSEFTRQINEILLIFSDKF